MKRVSIKELQGEIEAFRKRIAELEARPPVVIHNYPPFVQQPAISPYSVPPTPLWRPGEVWCATSVASDTLSWNGGVSPISLHGGGSGG